VKVIDGGAEFNVGRDGRELLKVKITAESPAAGRQTRRG